MKITDCRPDPHAVLGPLHDAHCHLDFMSNGEDVARAAAHDGVKVFANTVDLDGFEKARKRFGNHPNVLVGVGTHPWWVDDSFNPNRFERLARQTEFVGEVGLDFSSKHAANREAQINAFALIANICARQGRKLLSIHAVKSASTVLDILERADTLATCTCIFHWFSGSGDELVRAREAGCYFSVNPMMLATRRGREYVRQLPADRLLVETDAPPEQGEPYPYAELAASLELVRQALNRS